MFVHKASRKPQTLEDRSPNLRALELNPPKPVEAFSNPHLFYEAVVKRFERALSTQRKAFKNLNPKPLNPNP